MMSIKLIIFAIFVVGNVNFQFGNSQVCTTYCNDQQISQPSSNPHPNNLIRGKAGPKGIKGEIGHHGKKGERGIDCDQSTIETRFNQLESTVNDKIVTLKTELEATITASKDEIQSLKMDLDVTQTALNQSLDKFTALEELLNRIQRILLSNDELRLKSCGFLRSPSKIEDSQITASSFRAAYFAPKYGRLFGTSGYGAWLAKTIYGGDWIQADLGQDERIVAVVTQGRYSAGHNNWVTTYSVAVKIDGGAFNDVTDNSGNTIVFQGNTDKNTPVINSFPDDITARYIKITPLTWHAYPEMRFDVLWC